MFRLQSMFRYVYAGLLLLIGNGDILPHIHQQKVAISSRELSSSDISFLKTHALDASISAQLDKLFSLPEVQQCLSCIYTGYKGQLYIAREEFNRAEAACYRANPSQVKQAIKACGDAQNALERIEEAIKEALTVLTKCGFVFTGKEHIFTLQQIPGYVFKMALPWDDRSEWLNASRIRFAYKIRTVIKEKNLNVRVPRKWAYFVPENKEYVLPHVIVVAEMMDLSNPQPLSRSLWKDIDTITAITGFSDDHEGNVIGCGDYAVIVDTEERKYSVITQECKKCSVAKPVVMTYKPVALIKWQDRLKLHVDRIIKYIFAGIYERSLQIKRLFA